MNSNHQYATTVTASSIAQGSEHFPAPPQFFAVGIQQSSAGIAPNRLANEINVEREPNLPQQTSTPLAFESDPLFLDCFVFLFYMVLLGSVVCAMENSKHERHYKLAFWAIMLVIFARLIRLGLDFL